MTTSERQVEASIIFWKKRKDLVGDRISSDSKKVRGDWIKRKKQIADFWVFGSSVFAGLEVKETFGDDFDTKKSEPTRCQMMNLRNIERLGGDLGTGRGFFIIEFLSSSEPIEWYALRITWMDEYIEAQNTHVLKKAHIREAAESPRPGFEVIKLGVSREEKEQFDIIDLRPLLQGVSDG